MKKDQNTGRTEADFKKLEAENESLKADKKALQDTLKTKDERIAWLERQLFGSKSDKIKVKPADPNWPTFFDKEFKEAIAEISKLRKKAVNAPLTEKLWGVFYSTFVVKERIRLFPRVQEKIEYAKLNSLGQRAIIKSLKKGNGVAHIH